MMLKTILFITICVVAIGSYIFLVVNKDSVSNLDNNKTTNTITADLSNKKEITVVAQDLNVPWEILFLPNDEILLTERNGTILLLNQEKKIIKEIENVKSVGEAGLLGMALDPNFSANNYIYVYYTTEKSGSLINKVDRFTFINQKLQDQVTIIDNIPSANNHAGGRIAFGPDGYLYITTGDAQNPDLAQNKDSLAGKILRITSTGEIPSDNPFNNAVYSYGHRNPQGIAWDVNGNLWSTEHGPSGIESGYDEVNLIQKGANYGWPEVRGNQKKDNMVSPVIQSGGSDTWAPAGLAIAESKLFFTGLRGQTLYVADIENNNLSDLRKKYIQEYGRLRTVAINGDYLYITTSNKDGRGIPKVNDDKLIKIPLSIIE